MATTYYEDMGVQLQRGDAASPEVFTLIPQITSMGENTEESQELDVTTLDSTIIERVMSVLTDVGEITISGVWNPAHAQHAGLRTDRRAQTNRNFKLVLTDTDTTEIAFSAYVKSVTTPTSVERGGVGQFSAVLVLSSLPTYT